MAKENKVFEELLNKFCENGLLKEVYRSEKAVVCNVFNQFYIEFSLDEVQDYTKDFPGYIRLKSSGLLEILRNDNFINRYSRYVRKRLNTKLLMFLNDDSFAALLKMKADFVLNPPPCRLDLDFERKVMENGKAAIKGLRWHKYFLPFLLEKQNPAIELLPIVNYRNVFNELLNKYYENGLLKEVYRTERAVVCNAFDQFYIAFSLELVESYAQDFPGFMMNSFGLRSIVEDDTFVIHYYLYSSSEDQDEVLMILDEKQFQHFLAHKEEFQKRPPRVDLQFEQEVMEKGKDALKQEKNAPQA